MSIACSYRLFGYFGSGTFGFGLLGLATIPPKLTGKNDSVHFSVNFGF